MELNRRTKLAGGVLALAVAALIYDRVIAGSGPQAAQASPATAPSPTPDTREKPRPENNTPRGALAERLARLGQEPSEPPARQDVFVAPAGWFPEAEQPAVPPAPAAKQSTAHTLNSVLMEKGGEVKFAVIDKKVLRPGVPERVELEGKLRTYELVRAWIGADKLTHVEVKIDGQLQELTRKTGEP